MKRTRRIEVVRYSRRIMLTDGDADADVAARDEYAAAIGILSMTPGDTPSGPSLSDDASGQAADFEVCTPQRRRWYWLSWLKRE